MEKYSQKLGHLTTEELRDIAETILKYSVYILREIGCRGRKDNQYAVTYTGYDAFTVFYVIERISDNIHNLPWLIRSGTKRELIDELSYTMEFLSKHKKHLMIISVAGTNFMGMRQCFEKYNVDI